MRWSTAVGRTTILSPKRKKPSGSTISFVTAAVLVALHEARQAGVGSAPAVDRSRDGVDPPAAQAGFLLPLRRISQVPADAADQPPRRQPGPVAGLQRGHAALGRPAGDRRRASGPGSIGCSRGTCGSTSAGNGPSRTSRGSRWPAISSTSATTTRRCASSSSPKAQRPPFQDQLAHVLLRLQEKDGSWWDFPMFDYHQQYGTAFALMSLKRTCKAVEGAAAH